MKFYSVWVASTSYKSNKPLTYSYNKENLKTGTIVRVPLRNATVMGLVIGTTTNPGISIKNVASIVSYIPIPTQLIELIKWFSDYYPAGLGNTLISILPSISQKNPLKNTSIVKLPPVKPLPGLTPDQSKVIKSVLEGRSKSTLLHGETGSGKTRIYIELAKYAITNKRSVLVLTPEIGLTKQLENEFRAIFGHIVLIYHSRLTPSERSIIWQKILTRTGEPLIIIGPRSALFLPISSLGLVVMDEAHEAAYKQEQAPYYQTSRVAPVLARLHNAYFIMGSATPLISDYYYFKEKGLNIARIKTPAIKHAKPPSIKIVATTDRSQFTRSVLISNEMQKNIENALRSNEQSLIFLNRRGSARLVLCDDCNWRAICPNCESSLIFHADIYKTMCHLCSYSASPPISCPLCSSPNIVFKSAGTKSVTHELQKLFPNARINRFDTDNLKHERLENAYDNILAGEIDILIGTQLLGKGLDLPKLSCVGVVQADTSLYIPDYTADETTFQHLVQIIGRVGRGHRPGTVVIQTSNPNNSVISYAVKRDYESFYKDQLGQRRRFLLPPFVQILKLSARRKTQASAEKALFKLKDHIDSLELPLQISGPSPELHEKRSGYYYWQLIVKSRTRNSLTTILNNLPSGYFYDLDPVRLI